MDNGFRIIVMLISSGRIKWNLYDANGRTVFHVAVQKDNMRQDLQEFIIFLKMKSLKQFISRAD